MHRGALQHDAEGHLAVDPVLRAAPGRRLERSRSQELFKLAGAGSNATENMLNLAVDCVFDTLERICT